MIAPALILAPVVALTSPSEPRLVETGVGRFAVFADTASIRREGDVAYMRELQVVETGFEVGGTIYVGGWSRWAFDCVAGTADRLDFASLRSDGSEGPATPDPAPAFPAAPGGDAAELMAAACGGQTAPQGLSLSDAIIRGQAALAE